SVRGRARQRSQETRGALAHVAIATADFGHQELLSWRGQCLTLRGQLRQLLPRPALEDRGPHLGIGNGLVEHRGDHVAAEGQHGRSRFCCRWCSWAAACFARRKTPATSSLLLVKAV